MLSVLRIFFFGILSIASADLYAQAHRAILLGQVTDRTGSAVPAAEVRVIQKETNVVRTTRTNENGNYEVPGLLPGTYRVETSPKGFKTAAVDQIQLASAKRGEVNLIVEVGDVAESIVVRAEAQLLDTASADVNTVIDQRKVADLPVGQGNTTYLFFMASGTAMLSTTSQVSPASSMMVLRFRTSSSVQAWPRFM